MPTLEIKNLKASVEDKDILKGINLKINSGEIHAIMGQNGSGKSTLCNTLMGSPRFKIQEGIISLDNEELNNLSPDKRAKKGLFLAFQNPIEIPGVHLPTFLRSVVSEVHGRIDPEKFIEELEKNIDELNLKKDLLHRDLNDGLSGGEKKQSELLQMAMLRPKFAIIDEIDSGLDIDALKIVAEGIKSIAKKHNTGIVLITHYQRILNYIHPDFVHIINKGKIIKSGDKKLAEDLEQNGYIKYLKDA
ncbi:Fe-S cluster assembly ATPase SufC [Candidatus Peregrinibacteria bacterium]|nr:Fe-S cluster assembly ATPase SufC [Candidatus Peregrinibacteria bacterium]